MDPYFRPILIASAAILVLSVFPIIPIAGGYLMAHVIGGIAVVYLFKKELKAEREITWGDINILGIGTGLIVASVMSLIITLKFQDESVKTELVNAVNEQMRMQSTGEFENIDVTDSLIKTSAVIASFVMSLVLTYFPALATLAIINRPNR